MSLDLTPGVLDELVWDAKVDNAEIGAVTKGASTRRGRARTRASERG